MNIISNFIKPFTIATLFALSASNLAGAVPQELDLPDDIRATAESLKKSNFSIFKKQGYPGRHGQTEQFLILVSDDELSLQIAQSMSNLTQGVAEGISDKILGLFKGKTKSKKNLIIRAKSIRKPHTTAAMAAALTADAAIILGGLAIRHYSPRWPSLMSWFIPNPIRIVGGLVVVAGLIDAVVSHYGYQLDRMPKQLLYLPGVNITSRSSAYQVADEIHELMNRKTPVRIVVQVEKRHAKYLLPLLESDPEYELVYVHTGREVHSDPNIN